MNQDSTAQTTPLTKENVYRIFMSCLYRASELPEIPADISKDHKATAEYLQEQGCDCILVEGVRTSAIFHPDRLEENAQHIKDMLRQLPESFDLGKDGRGDSFLVACNTREGYLWGQRRDMDCLFIMSVALGLAKFTVERINWSGYPGGMPYVGIDFAKF